MELEEGNDKRELSALLDGELMRHEFIRLAAKIGDARVQRNWQTYVLIGDCLRADPQPRHDLVAAVMARLENEPTVLAPRNLAQRERQPKALLALAASVAGVAVVAWLAVAGGRGSGSAPTMVASSSQRVVVNAMPMVSTAQRASTPTQHEISDYLLAHHVHASGFRYGDGSQHVRTVSWIAGGDRP